MKKILTFFKKTLIFIGTLLGVVLVIGIIFLNVSPQFGGEHTPSDIIRFEQSENFIDGKFQNQSPTKTSPSLSDTGRLLQAMFGDVSEPSPSKPIKVEKVHYDEFVQRSVKTKFVWFGHSTFLIEIEGKRILLDPVFSEVPAPHPWLGNKRFSKELPIKVRDLPQIDAVIISHDHYDHLDYESILQIKGRVKKYFVPLGLGSHLQAWGVAKTDIVEMDWWDETTFDNLKLIAAPARHFSGRGFSDSRATLWASWIIQSESENIFFSGDSGYDGHFKEIGEKYGPFDLALMECGQYNDNLPDYPIHLYPEQTAQAALDVKAEFTLPIHWAAFKLNQHPWKEPIERLSKKADQLNVKLVTPKIGQVFMLNNLENTSTPWWEKY